jgi:HPr kinase/phosphorylase
MNKKIKLKDLIEQFELDVVTGQDNLENEIAIYGLNRAGLELSGFFEEGTNGHRLILMSTKEYTFMQNFDEDERYARYEALIHWGIPGIIITKKFKDDVLLKVAEANNFPLVKTNMDSTSEFSRELLEFMDEFFAPSEEIHGSLVNIFGKGVLIKGASGIGKSEITLDLVKKNHMFVGDDRIVLKRKANKIFGRSHPIIANMVEVRGIGIINIAETYGFQIIMEESPIDLIIELSHFELNNGDNYERIGRSFETVKILGTKIPYIKIPVSSGRNIANIVETAVSQLKLIQTPGFKRPVDIIDKRLRKFNEGDE